MDSKRAEDLLYNAICGLEESGWNYLDILDYLCMSEDEWADLMGIEEEEN